MTVREARREGSPYPKADLTLRGLARLVDLVMAFAVTQAAHEVGPVLGVLYLLLADGFMHGQSVGKRIFGVRTMVLPKRVPAGYRESMLRNAPFALVALFSVVPIAWLLVPLVGLPVVAFEGWMVWSDRLGVRIGDIFADTQVVDAKVVSKIEVVAHPLHPATPTPPGQSAREARPAGAARGAA
ncbi:MAG TPA: hypothetical protein VFR85_09420 [Anaeromyxobacteraceae bacterium]|nr:hypothetical protein [Anaeromyxobacteraceae bacterium]